MSRPSSFLYLWVFLAALGGGIALTPIAKHFGTRLGVVDSSGGHEAHLEPIPLLGGLAIYGGAFAGAWLLAPGARTELKGFFLAGLVILVFGIQDDITRMDPWVKLFAQITAALVLVGFGVRAHLTDVGVVDVALTVLWVVAVVNAANLQDNMNGLAAGLATVSSLGFFALAVTEEQYLVAVLSVGLAGGALGFLADNYPRARIYMGDAGSMMLGFILAFLGIRLRFLDQPQTTSFFLPAIVLAVPLFDTAMVSLSRLRRGVSITEGGTDHTSHRLVRAGLPHWAAVAVLWGIQAALAGAAFAMARHPVGVDAAVFGAVAAGGIAALWWLELRRAPESAAQPTPVDTS